MTRTVMKEIRPTDTPVSIAPDLLGVPFSGSTFGVHPRPLGQRAGMTLEGRCRRGLSLRHPFQPNCRLSAATRRAG